jgi:choloylglycine hydrolase
MLPGTSRPADRFIRASYYVKTLPQTDDIYTALAGIFGVIRNVSVPLGISTPGQPNVSSTRWRTIADHKNKVYYFETAFSPFILWVDFKDVDFSSKGKVKKLTLVNGEIYSGNAIKDFVDSEPFKFAGIYN